MFWFRIFLLGWGAAAGGHPVITEVMSNPASGEDTIPGGRSNEFIELYNPGPDTVDLYGYTFSDGDALDSVVAWDPARFGSLRDPDALVGGTRLLPQRFAVILDQDYAAPANHQPYDVPPGILILAAANTTLGDGLAAGDPLALYAPGGHDLAHRVSTFGRPEETDDYHFANSAGLAALDPPDGVSLERVFFSLPDSAAFWVPSPRPAGHSLGWHYLPAAPTAEDTAGDTAGPGPRWWQGADSLSSRSGVAVSEYMPDPGPGRAEWVEIYNRGTRVVDLFHWQLGDGAGAATVTTSHIPLSPGEYAVLRDRNDTLPGIYALVSVRVISVAGWRSLLNQGRDAIIFRNCAGMVVDSVAYDADARAGLPGVSWERRDLAGRANDPANWSLCKNAAGATPGFANSTAGAAASRLELVPESRAFCPQEGGLFRCVVRYPPAGELRLAVLDASGGKVRSLPFDYNLRGEVEWDGRGPGGIRCPAGVYVLAAESRVNGTVVERQKCAFILVRY